jgi:AmiR/NasT family two-component response regulator
MAKIVIAEDEAIIRMDLVEILEEAGHDVVGQTGRGDEAMELVESNNPDLVILDVRMPGMNGIEVAKKVNETSNAAILILTSYSQQELMTQAREVGASAYIVKPVQKDDFINSVNVALVRKSVSTFVDSVDEDEKSSVKRKIDEAICVIVDNENVNEFEAWQKLGSSGNENVISNADKTLADNA